MDRQMDNLPWRYCAPLSSRGKKEEIVDRRIIEKNVHTFWQTTRETVSFVESLDEGGAEPVPGAVDDKVGRVGDEWSGVFDELTRLVSSTVVVRVTDR